MCASPFGFLRAGPPPPKVALLPDGMFFTRAVPVAPGATPADAASQVELALEAVSPFPLAQLYYGWFWLTGADHALVFAAYRRRFTTDQAAEWEGAELVLPSFAAVLGAPVEPATTIVLHGSDSITAVQWVTPPVPARVLFAPLPPDVTDDDRAGVREELVRGLGGSVNVIDVPAPVAADAAQSDNEMVFRSGELVSKIPSSAASALDVRDKAELAALRSARQRDIVLWRVAVGAAAGLLLLLVGELALFAGGQWQSVRLRELAAQQPLVDKISNLHALANRIDEIATKRLLPIEMVIATAEAKPDDIIFTRATADRSRGLYKIVVEATTVNAAQINAYESALRALPSVESAVATIAQMRNDRASFYVTVVFKPDILKPLQQIAASP